MKGWLGFLSGLAVLISVTEATCSMQRFPGVRLTRLNYQRVMTAAGVEPSSLATVEGVCLPDHVRVLESCYVPQDAFHQNLYGGSVEAAQKAAADVGVTTYIDGDGDVVVDPYGTYGVFESLPLQRVTFPRSSQIRVLGDTCFAWTQLTTISIPPGVEKIGCAAFYGCPLTSVEFAQQGYLASIGDDAFNETALREVVLPASVQFLGDRCFANSALTSVQFAADSALESVGEECFIGNDLEDITLPASLVRVGARCFAYAPLRRLEFAPGSQLMVIGKEAFRNTFIQSLKFPDSVQQIMDFAFVNTPLKKVEWSEHSEICHIGAYAFSGTAIRDVVVPGAPILGVQCFGLQLASIQLLNIDFSRAQAFLLNFVNGVASLFLFKGENDVYFDFIHSSWQIRRSAPPLCVVGARQSGDDEEYPFSPLESHV